MFKSISKYTYFSFIPIVIIGMLTAVLIAIGHVPTYYLWYTLLGWSLIAGLGIEVGYHRLFSHGHHVGISRTKENIILFFGALGGQGSSISWAAVHRQHHRHTDTNLDPHTPTKGIWYAFFDWTRQITENNNSINFKKVPDLLRKSNHQWFHRNHLCVLWLSILLLALYDWKLSLALIVLPSALTTLVNNLINVVCHTKFYGNYRNHHTDDNSCNSPIFAYISWGLGWHNNHHSNPSRITFCNDQTEKWWEFDPAKIFIFMLDIKCK